LTELATRESTRAESPADIIESVVLKGDLAKLTADERVAYYRETCRSLGLNELTQPFAYINLNGKLTLYATKSCTDQLRKLHRVNITRQERSTVGDIHLVTVYATDREGRQDSSTGAVAITGLRGDALANALMKAETKAKRRVTLSLCGLGWTDESELETIPYAMPVQVDPNTGEVLEPERYIPTDEREVEDAPRPPRDRRGLLLERYGAMLTQARHAGVVQDAAPWVLRSDTPEAEIERVGKELKARIEESRNALSPAERSEAPAELTTPPAF
jgi:hypothetical protein